MPGTKARSVVSWPLSVAAVVVFSIPGVCLWYVTNRANEGTLPLPSFLKPHLAEADPPVPPRLIQPPVPREQVLAKVVDGHGNPAAGLPARLRFVRETGKGPEDWTQDVVTDEKGYARFENLPTRFDGGWVEVQPKRGWPVRTAVPFDGKWPVRCEAVVVEAPALRVRATDPAGRPLESAEVRAVFRRRLEGEEARIAGREALGGHGNPTTRTAWRIEMKNLLRGVDGVERFIDGWTSVTEEGVEEAVAVAGRPLGKGEFEFPRVPPDAGVLVLGWGPGREMVCLRVGAPVPGDTEERLVDLTLPASAQLEEIEVITDEGKACRNAVFRLLPPGIPPYLNMGVPPWRTDDRGRLSGPALEGGIEHAVVLEVSDSNFMGVTRYLGSSGTWRPASGDPIRLDRGVPPLFRATIPIRLEGR